MLCKQYAKDSDNKFSLVGPNLGYTLYFNLTYFSKQLRLRNWIRPSKLIKVCISHTNLLRILCFLVLVQSLCNSQWLNKGILYSFIWYKLCKYFATLQFVFGIFSPDSRLCVTTMPVKNDTLTKKKTLLNWAF